MITMANVPNREYERCSCYRKSLPGGTCKYEQIITVPLCKGVQPVLANGEIIDLSHRTANFWKPRQNSFYISCVSSHVVNNLNILIRKLCCRGAIELGPGD